MGNLCLLLAIFFSNFVCCASIRDELLFLIPKQLRNISVEDNQFSLKTKLSMYLLPNSNDQTLYLKFSNESNRLATIGLEKGKFQYLLISTTENDKKISKRLFQDIYKRLPKDKSKFIRRDNEGRYLVIDIPNEALKLKFTNNEDKNLESIIMWPVGSNLQ